MQHTVRVKLSDGDSFITGINGTKEEIRDYYFGGRFVAQDENTLRTVTALKFIA